MTDKDTNSTDKPQKEGYIDNKKLYQDMCNWKEKYYKNNDIPLSEELGAAILLISENASRNFRFSSYSNLWKQEMIDDAIFDCVRYLKRFNEKENDSIKLFNYMTTICCNAFIKRINTEKAKSATKYKYYLNHVFSTESLDDGLIDSEFYFDIVEKLEEHEETKRKRKAKQQARKKAREDKSVGLDTYMESDK